MSLKMEKKVGKKVEPMVEVRVTVKIALKDAMSSKVMLKADVARGFQSGGGFSGTKCHKKGRERLRIGVNDQFEWADFNALYLVSFPVRLLWPRKCHMLPWLLVLILQLPLVPKAAAV